MTQEISVFQDSDSFELAQRQAKAFASSSLVPKEFQGNLPNCLIAMDMARRLGANPLAVMQELYIVHGKPSWSSKFVIACINQCGKFTPLRFETDVEETWCVAWAREHGSDEILRSPRVSLEMAKAEGWSSKNGSKWKTMPGLMLRYRAATFFGRLYAPDLLLGIKTSDEMDDIQPQQQNPFAAIEAVDATVDLGQTEPVEDARTEQQKADDSVFEGDA